MYDCSDLGLFSATRLWYMFRVFGHDHVSVLDGGFAKWSAEKLPLDNGAITFPVCLFSCQLQSLGV